VHTTQTSLLWAVRDGEDHQAWSVFHRIYAPMLGSFCRRLGLGQADADDVSQEVLMIAHRALCEGAYDPNKGKFRGWLYGVTRKRALTAHRARQRRTRAQAMAREDGVDLLGGIPDTHEETQREIWEQEWRFAMLDEALRQLQPTLGEKVYRSFVLYGLERRPVEEVAEALGIAVASVYTYKTRVLKAIREWVGQFEDDASDPVGD
jgi:RNA polymerase sigma-70 factor (ECF subfamily)